MSAPTLVHLDPYLDDGNIVLEAISSNGAHHVFRVHRSLLCRQSDIFAEMFAVASSPASASQNMYEGCSLIHMPDDSQDLADLLRMMYDSRYAVFYAHSLRS